MSFGREIKRRLQAAVPPLLFLALAGYFVWSATQGERGLKSYAKRQDDLKLAQQDLQRAQAEISVWERRVAGLRTSHLDPDALDERARAMLNLSDGNDIVVPYGQGKRLY